MATQVTVITGEGSTTYSVSTGARGPAGPSSGATPAGTTGSVQINNSGALAADSGLVYTGTGNTGVLKIGGGSVIMSDPAVSQNVSIGGGNPTLPFANRTTGNYNTSIGTGNLPLLTTGNKNVAIGTSTLASVTTGSDNFGFGVNTLFSLTSGTNNIAIGTGVAPNITSGADNICIGGNPLGSTNVSSIAIGADSDGSSTTVIGRGGNAPNTQTRLIGNTLILGRQDLTTGTDKRTSIVQTAQTDNKTITLPNANGKVPVYTDTPAIGQVLTATDASGAATWEDVSGGDLTIGPVTSTAGVSAIADNALSIAKTSGLQSVLPTPNLRGLNNTINSIAEAGDGPISIIILGDSYATNFVGFGNGNKVVGSYRCGGATSGGNTGVTTQNSYALSPDSKYNRVASGGILSCGHLESGAAGPVSHIYYTLFPGAGTAQFSFSVNNGSTWTNAGSAIDTSLITDVQVGSIALPTPGYYSSVISRMTVTVGNVNGWIGQGLDGPGVTQISFATTGQGIEQCADITPAIWKKMVAGWRTISSVSIAPTSIVYNNYYTITTVGTTNFVTTFGASANTVGTVFRATTSGLSNDTTTGRVSQSESQIILSVFADYRFTTVPTTNYPTVGIAAWAASGPANDLYVNSRALNANPSCDWFLVGPHSVDPAKLDENLTAAQLATTAAFAAIGINTLNTQIRNVDGAKAQREFAERLGTGFVDCIPMFPNYTLAVAEGNYTDDIHLSARGQFAKRAYVYNNSNLGYVLGSEAYRSSMRLGNVKLAATTARSAGTYALSVTDISGLNLAPIIASDLRAGLSGSEANGAVIWQPSSNVVNIGFFQPDNNRRSFLSLDSNALTTGSSATLTLGSAALPWAVVSTNGLRVGFVKKTADYTIPRNSNQDYMIACDGTFTVTLPLARFEEASGLYGRVYIIKNIGTTVVTVAALSTSPIAATAMVAGTTYVIEFTGTTVFTSFGAASNNVGTSFVATGVGTGTGTLRNVLQKIDNATTVTLAAGATLRLISAQTAGFTSADWGNWLTW